jgi:hypothetical protein
MSLACLTFGLKVLVTVYTKRNHKSGKMFCVREYYPSSTAVKKFSDLLNVVFE